MKYQKKIKTHVKKTGKDIYIIVIDFDLLQKYSMLQYY